MHKLILSIFYISALFYVLGPQSFLGSSVPCRSCCCPSSLSGTKAFGWEVSHLALCHLPTHITFEPSMISVLMDPLWSLSSCCLHPQWGLCESSSSSICTSWDSPLLPGPTPTISLVFLRNRGTLGSRDSHTDPLLVPPSFSLQNL